MYCLSSCVLAPPPYPPPYLPLTPLHPLPPGSVIMYGSFLLLHDEFLHVVAISFTALVVTELVMVGLTIRTWHWLMVVAELGSIAIYIASLGILTQYFGEGSHQARGLDRLCMSGDW